MFRILCLLSKGVGGRKKDKYEIYCLHHLFRMNQLYKLQKITESHIG